MYKFTEMTTITRIVWEGNVFAPNWFMKASGTVVLLTLVMSVAFACLFLVLSQPGGSIGAHSLSLFFGSGV